jgi:hypothetical protein
MLAFREGIADNGSIEISSPDSVKPIIFETGEGLIPYFGSASANNTLEASYNQGG